MDSNESLKRFVSLFPDLPTRERKESQTLGTLTDSEEGVFHDMRTLQCVSRPQEETSFQKKLLQDSSTVHIKNKQLFFS